MVFVGNNPAGQPAITGGLPGDIYLGPGVGGVMAGGTADYVRTGSGHFPWLRAAAVVRGTWPSALRLGTA